MCTCSTFAKHPLDHRRTLKLKNAAKFKKSLIYRIKGNQIIVLGAEFTSGANKGLMPFLGFKKYLPTDSVFTVSSVIRSNNVQSGHPHWTLWIFTWITEHKPSYAAFNLTIIEEHENKWGSLWKGCCGAPCGSADSLSCSAIWSVRENWASYHRCWRERMKRVLIVGLLHFQPGGDQVSRGDAEELTYIQSDPVGAFCFSKQHIKIIWVVWRTSRFSSTRFCTASSPTSHSRPLPAATFCFSWAVNYC